MFLRTLAVVTSGLVTLCATAALGETLKWPIVWIDYDAKVAADRLLHAGVNKWDPGRLVPFVACSPKEGTAITAVGVHPFSGYADVVVNDQSGCAGVVDLENIQ